MKNFSKLIVAVFALATLLVSGCGGGSNDSNGPLSQQESQRYFPLTDSNVWVTWVTNSVNGTETASYTRVSQRAGSRLVGNVMTSVMSNTDLPSFSMQENYLAKDEAGIMIHGNNISGDTLTAALVPYRLLSFPIQVGSSFRQIDKTGLDYGWDHDGDRVNEKIDIRTDVYVRGFETVSTFAGTFEKCLRIDANVTETLTLSADGRRLTATGVETTWYAKDIGPVKQSITISSNGSTNQTIEELSGYMVEGRCVGLRFRVTPSTATISAGSTVQLGVTLLDANDRELRAIAAIWEPDDSSVVSVDSAGLATGNKIGIASLTPSVGGVAGPKVSLNVLVGFDKGVSYPAPSSVPLFVGGDTAMGDLNGDGRNDVAVIERNGSRILIYYQNASGTFDAPQVISTSLILSGIAIGDVNSDGLADLVVSGNSTTETWGWPGRVAVFSQNPASHIIKLPQEYTISTDRAGTLAIADLNGDGLKDIVVASAGGISNGLLSFLFQGATGTLGAEFIYTAVPILPGAEIHVADMNSDGRNDIVVQGIPKQLAVIKQLSPGVFSTTPDLYIVQTKEPYFSTISFDLGDFNGDGRTDIVAVDMDNNGYLNTFFQNAAGLLTEPRVQVLEYCSPQGKIKIIDIDGDGLDDIVFFLDGNFIMTLLQTATHTFQEPQHFFLPTSSYDQAVMSIGDVTGDGLPDVVVSTTNWGMNGGVFVLPRR